MALVCFVVVMLVAPSQGSGQTLQPFEDLALRVNLGDELQVEDRSGVKVTGRLTRLTRDQIAIQSRAGETCFAIDAVRAVAARDHPLRTGALVGAGVFAVLGAVAVCSHEGGDYCAGVGSLGAGVGLAVGALTSRMRLVYRAPDAGASVQGSGGAAGVQARLLEDLALRVNLNDRLRIEDASGGLATGRLTRLTADQVTLETAAGDMHFTRETARRVAVRRQPLRTAVLVGAGLGAATGAVAGCTGPEREECADAPIITGAFGAAIGLAVGALIHTTTIVYPEPEKQTLLAPLISRGAVGVRVSRRWSPERQRPPR